MTRDGKPRRATQEEAVLRDIARARMDEADALAVLAVNIARKVDSGEYTAADARELRLTILDMRRTSTPAKGGDDLDRIRRRRRAAGRPDGPAGPAAAGGSASD